MRKAGWLLSMLLLLLILAGCASQQKEVVGKKPLLRKETPKEVVERFAQAIQRGDFAEAESCLTERCRNQTYFFGFTTSQVLQGMHEQMVSFAILGEEIVGETANVRTDWEGNYSPGGYLGINENVILYKSGGKWKIDSFLG